jgi:hypothetical protein
MPFFTAAAIPAIASVGSAAIGAGMSLAGGQGQSSTTQQTTNSPWAPQAPALESAIGQAGNIENNQLAAGPYQGSLYSGESADSLAASKNAENVAAQGNNLASQDAAVGSTLTGAAPAYVNNATNMAANGIPAQNAAEAGQLQNVASGQTGVVNSGLSGALNTSATNAANSVAGYNAGTTSVMNAGMTDPTAKLAADASQYANSGYAQQSINAANSQIENTLNETTNPGINRQAALGGNMNSSRAGMAEAMANSQAALDEGSTDAAINNNAYNSGLSTAAQQYTSGLNTSLAASTAGATNASNLALGTANNQVSATNTQDAAATAGLNAQNANAATNANTQLAANQQLGQAVNTGLTANNDAQNIGVSDTSQLAGSGQIQQANTSAQDAANYQTWQNSNQYDSGVLNNYMGVVNAPKYGSASVDGTTTPSQNTAGSLAGLGTTIGAQFANGGALNSNTVGSPFANNTNSWASNTQTQPFGS